MDYMDKENKEHTSGKPDLDIFRDFLENRPDLNDARNKENNVRHDSRDLYNLTSEWLDNHIEAKQANLYRRLFRPWIAYSIIPKILFILGIMIGTIWAISSLNG